MVAFERLWKHGVNVESITYPEQRQTAMAHESSNVSSLGTQTEASQTVRIQLDNLATIEVRADRRGEEVVDLKLDVHAPDGGVVQGRASHD